jgi:hypothetical protein
MDLKRIGIGLGTALGAAAAVVGGALLYDVAARKTFRRQDGHKAPDLDEDKPHPGPDHRAPEAFRPDPTAPVPAFERDALAPATEPAPTLSEDRGAMRSQTAPANG